MAKEKNPSEEQVVYVGRKPTMSYVLAVLTAFNRPGIEEVALKARGRAISCAVDFSEIVTRKFLKGVKVGEIKMGSESMTTEENYRTRTVSTMEITLTRAKPSKGKAGNE